MARKHSKGEQKQGTCVYCGEEGLITKDHVFPQVIFLVLDEQMITVPACEACQRFKSLGDRDLRNYIIMDIGGSQHPDAIEMAERMLREANVRTRNWIRKQMASAKTVDLITETGVIVGSAIEFEFNTERIGLAQEMVVRGLHYHETGELLPPNCPINIQFIPWQAAPRFVQDLTAKTSLNVKVKGKNVAWWSPVQIEDTSDNSSAWLICYNNWVPFFCTTGDLAQRVAQLRKSYESQAVEEAEVINAGPRRVVVPRDPEGRPMIPPQ